MSSTKAPAPTSSPALSAPEVTRKVAKRKRGKAKKKPLSSSATTAPKGRKRGPQKKLNWESMKVFDRPLYRMPYQLAKYRKGKKGLSGDPPLWMQVAIESGLVEMGSQSKGCQGGALLEPIGKAPPPRASREELIDMITLGLIESYEKMKT